MALTELLWQISYRYNCELRPYLDLLLQLLLIEDSWQTQRILSALKVPEGWRGKRQRRNTPLADFSGQDFLLDCWSCEVEFRCFFFFW